MIVHDKDRVVVLVVEDEPLLLLAATELLNEAGFVAIGSGSADEALKLLKGPDRINALVTDIDLPGEANGFGVAWCAHSLGMTVVVVSGRVIPSSDLLPPGSTFLPKPVDDEELIGHLLRAR
jgi:CheY-like chemotaxis protein